MMLKRVKFYLATSLPFVIGRSLVKVVRENYNESLPIMSIIHSFTTK